MFDGLGFALGVLTPYPAVSGQVWAKAGPAARLVERDTSPAYFWTVIAISATLAAALALWS